MSKNFVSRDTTELPEGMFRDYISYIKEYENQNNSGKIENFIEPDDELSDLWNYLGVTQKYRSMFLHNLLYFI